MCVPLMPCEECPGPVTEGNRGLPALVMGVGWREPGSSHSVQKTMLHAGSPLIFASILWGKVCLCHFADEKTKVQRHLIWLVKVQKDFTVEVNSKQGLGGG